MLLDNPFVLVLAQALVTAALFFAYERTLSKRDMGHKTFAKAFIIGIIAGMPLAYYAHGSRGTPPGIPDPFL